MNIRFNLRSDTSSNKKSINLILNKSNKKLVISTRIIIDKKDWIEDQQKTTIADVNQKLDKIKKDVVYIIENSELDFNDWSKTSKYLRKEIKSILPEPDGANDIKLARIKSGLTQIQLAEKIGVHQVVLSSWENGKHKPTGLYKKAIDKFINKHL